MRHPTIDEQLLENLGLGFPEEAARVPCERPGGS